MADFRGSSFRWLTGPMALAVLAIAWGCGEDETAQQRWSLRRHSPVLLRRSPLVRSVPARSTPAASRPTSGRIVGATIAPASSGTGLPPRAISRCWWPAGCSSPDQRRNRVYLWHHDEQLRVLLGITSNDQLGIGNDGAKLTPSPGRGRASIQQRARRLRSHLRRDSIRHGVLLGEEPLRRGRREQYPAEFPDAGAGGGWAAIPSGSRRGTPQLRRNDRQPCLLLGQQCRSLGRWHIYRSQEACLRCSAASSSVWSSPAVGDTPTSSSTAPKMGIPAASRPTTVAIAGARMATASSELVTWHRVFARHQAQSAAIADGGKWSRDGCIPVVSLPPTWPSVGATINTGKMETAPLRGVSCRCGSREVSALPQ